jgi:pimeloyl-ACP methyl ester carboxylesterase
MPVRRVADRLSSLKAVAAVAWIDNSGHMAVLRHPDWFAPVISSFIRQIESS